MSTTPETHTQPGRPLSIGMVDVSGLNWRQRTRRRGPFGAAPASTPTGNTYVFLPYSVGLLQVYVQQFAKQPERYDFRPTVFRRQPVATAVDALIGCDVVGFSTYCWNIELSLAIARELKARQPETLIVFGGPQVPDAGESFLRANPQVDVACHGEGEATFLALLEAWPGATGPGETRPEAAEPEATEPGATKPGATKPGAKWPEIGSISYLDADHRYVLQPKRTRLKDLNVIPSPYLSGVFDGLMRDNPDVSWHVLWETNRGCPFSCTFCDWGSAIASKVYQFDIARLRSEVDWFAEQRIEFIFVCDANFGILPRDLDLAQYIADVRQARRFPWSVAVQNTKNATERAFKIQTLIASISTSGVTIALQSVDPHTLKSIKRDNISVASFQELQRRYVHDGIQTYTDVIIGLPGESYDSFANGVDSMIRSGQYNRLQFYNCYLLPNAEMASPEHRQRFALETVRSRMVIDHEPVDRPPEQIDEYLELMIASSTMPAEAWVRTKAFAWMTELLHCDRVLQVPLVVLHAVYGMRFRTMIEAFTGADPARFPVVAGAQALFIEQARNIQRGGDEYRASREWLEIAWPADEIALIRMATTWTLDAFYLEAEQILLEVAHDGGFTIDPSVLHDAVVLNQHWLRVPFEIDDIQLDLDHDVHACYQATVTGAPQPLEHGPVSYRIHRTDPVWLTWEDWMEDLARRQNDKRAFLYPLTRLELSLAHPNAAIGGTIADAAGRLGSDGPHL